MENYVSSATFGRVTSLIFILVYWPRKGGLLKDGLDIKMCLCLIFYSGKFLKWKFTLMSKRLFNL